MLLCNTCSLLRVNRHKKQTYATVCHLSGIVKTDFKSNLSLFSFGSTSILTVSLYLCGSGFKYKLQLEQLALAYNLIFSQNFIQSSRVEFIT